MAFVLVIKDIRNDLKHDLLIVRNHFPMPNKRTKSNECLRQQQKNVFFNIQISYAINIRQKGNHNPFYMFYMFCCDKFRTFPH